MRLCACVKGPLRDTSDPRARHHCARCKGVTPWGRKVSLEETARLVAHGHSLLDKILVDLTQAHDACYGLRAPAEGRRAPGPANPTARLTTGPPGAPWDEQEHLNPWEESAQYAALASQWVRDCVARLLNADEAAGLALYVLDPHRGTTTTKDGRWWERPVTADTPPSEVPVHLRDVHAALLARRARGEP